METTLSVSLTLLWLLVLLNMSLTVGLARRIRAGLPRLDVLRDGQLAPEFAVSTLDGHIVTKATYLGHIQALLFVSPACKPCRHLLADLRGLEEDARRHGAELLVVSDGAPEETAEFIDLRGSTVPVLVAPRGANRLLSDYRVAGSPFHCLIDSRGFVISAGFGTPDYSKIGLPHGANQGAKVSSQ